MFKKKVGNTIGILRNVNTVNIDLSILQCKLTRLDFATESSSEYEATNPTIENLAQIEL